MLFRSNKTRLRPILMTTLMLIAAMVPIALGQGPGAGARASMAKVIIGGQGLSLLLTLLVTPVAYSLWEDFSRYWWRFWSWVGRRRPQKAGHETASPSQDGEELVVAGAVASVPSFPRPVTENTPVRG